MIDAATHEQVWDTLYEEARKLHAEFEPLREFCAFPSQTSRKAVEPKYDKLTDVMTTDQTMQSGVFDSFRAASLAAAPYAKWRQTYADTKIGEELHHNFGCYEVIGDDTVLHTDEMRSFLVYQRPGYFYPLHHHPAEEMYVVLSGAGEFAIEGAEPRWLEPGDTAYHPSNKPHSLRTKDQPVLAYVIWRNHLTTKPVFTYPDDL